MSPLWEKVYQKVCPTDLLLCPVQGDSYRDVATHQEGYGHGREEVSDHVGQHQGDG